MNSREIRSLQQAYLEVYQELDEVLDTPQKTQSYAAKNAASAVGAFFRGDSKTLSKRFKGAERGMKKIEKRNSQQEIEEGMTIKDFKNNIKKLKKREERADARSRGHVSKDLWTKGETYDTDSARRRRSNLTPETRATRHSSRRNPDEYDSSVMQRDYPGTITKNPKKLRKQKAMGEFPEQVDIYDIILSHLIDEGYAETPEAAEVIMVNMSEGWIQNIVEVSDKEVHYYDGALSDRVSSPEDKVQRKIKSIEGIRPVKNRTPSQQRRLRRLKAVDKDMSFHPRYYKASWYEDDNDDD